MPLTKKGQKIMRNMKEQYGEEAGERVFYASKNKGIITGVDTMDDQKREPYNPQQIGERVREYLARSGVPRSTSPKPVTKHLVRKGDNLAITRPPQTQGPGGEPRSFDPIHDYMDAVGKGIPVPPLVRTR